jgi:hypothetical protein
MAEIERLREELMKMLNEQKGDSVNNVNQVSDRANKTTYGVGLRKRSDSSQSSDLAGKVNELNMRINMLEKMMNSRDDHNNPEKLPIIKKARRDINSSGNEKSHKKEIADLKHELEMWMKSYFMSQQKPNVKDNSHEW